MKRLMLSIAAPALGLVFVCDSFGQGPKQAYGKGSAGTTGYTKGYGGNGHVPVPAPIYKTPAPNKTPYHCPPPVARPAPPPIYKQKPPVYVPQSPIYKPYPPAYEPCPPVYAPQPPIYKPYPPAYEPCPPVYAPYSPIYSPYPPAKEPFPPVNCPPKPPCEHDLPATDVGYPIEDGYTDQTGENVPLDDWQDAGLEAGGVQQGDEIILDEEGQMDADILVDDSQAQYGLRAGASSLGRVTVKKGSNGHASQVRVLANNGQTKVVPGIRLRSANGNPLALQQFRVRTAAGQIKTVTGIRAQTSGGKSTVLPVTQVKTRDGKTATFLQPPNGRNLKVTPKSNAVRK